MTLRIPTEQKPGRMAPLTRLPVFFTLDGKHAMIAGGTAAAAWKAELLSATGARVNVYAERFSDELQALADHPPRGPIVLNARGWKAPDLDGASLAIGAFDNDADAEIFARAARTRGVPVNVIDKPTFCDFNFGAIVNRSPLVVGISTDGAAPVFAQAIRGRIEAMLPKGFAAWADAARVWRTAVKALPQKARRKFWECFADHAIRHPQATPTEIDFARFADVSRTAAEAKGSVTLVGAGPGDPDLLTLAAVRALQTADLILFDDLVSAEVLDFARREARKLMVGKTGFGPSCRQEDINAMMVSLASQGKRVVRLKGGDPLIFGRAAEEIEACAAAHIPVAIIPGITAAQGAAAELNVPLTGRGQARRVQYVTGHAREGRLPDDLDWKSLVDPACTTAVYMPAQTLAAFTARAVEEGIDPATPAIAISRATRPDRQVIRSSVAEIASRLKANRLPGPLLVLIGRVLAHDARTAASATAAHQIAATEF